MPTGVYTAYRKDKSEYYRVSITYRNKHISLGSFDDKETAGRAYAEASAILYNPQTHRIYADQMLTDYDPGSLSIPFGKYVSLINYRDNNIYIKTPVYLCRKYFLYFLEPEVALRFNTDDLFYYSNHKIMARGGYYFVNDYGMQTSILSRYGIRAHAVKGRDYIFRNGNEHDFRYENIQIINRYSGVTQIQKKGRTLYRAAIHINGNYIIGDYPDEIQAAIAYNKAVDMLAGLTPVQYARNYIEDISTDEYASCYAGIKISRRLCAFIANMQPASAQTAQTAQTPQSSAES